ncbi:MAG: hypothetical protein WCA81_09425 [Rhizomicrobium sp.]
MIVNVAEYNNTASKNGWPALCDASVRFSHPDLRRLNGAWRKLGKPGQVLKYAELPPRPIKPYLADSVLYERQGTHSARRWRVKTMGQSFAQIMGDLGGLYLDDALSSELVTRWYAALDCTLGQSAPLRFLTRADSAKMSFLIGEYFSAPLLADDGSASLVLAVGRFTGGRSWEDVEAEARKTLGLS